MMRKLASIQVITNIAAIENANVIKVASVLGWKSVIKEGQFKEGDKCVFVEIDSVFPDKPEFEEFLKKSNRLKTIKLRGQISQGVCLPLNILPAGEYNIDDDVTDILGIIKYEAPIPAHLRGEIAGQFPSFIPKTDEPRIQTVKNLVDKYKGKLFSITEKLDGTSATYYIYNDKFGVCSRNWEYKNSENNLERNTYWKIAKRYDIENNLRKLNRNIAIQGEIIGEGIQSNTYGLHGQDFYIFNVLDIDTQKYILNHKDCFLQLEKNFKFVPRIEILELSNDIQSLIEKSCGNSVICPKVMREGFVYRPAHNDIYDVDFSMRVSFKVINPDYLLKYDA